MCKNEKLLTISIAAYNVEPYIEKTISSCLSEETNDLVEILVVDDGATDHTTQIADRFEEQYPDTVHVIRKENGGYGSTINTTIPLARGKYYKLLDGDDWFEKEGLISLLADLKTSDADMFITPYTMFSEKTGETELYEGLPGIASGDYLIEDIDIAEALRMHCLAFKTEILRDMDRKISEHCFYTDIEFISYPLSRVKTLHVSHVPVYCYRSGRDEQSMGILGIRKHFPDHEVVFKNLFTLYLDIEDKNAGYAKMLYKKLQEECVAHYQYLCMLKASSENKEKLKELDRKLKNYPDLYREVGEQSRVVSSLRRSNFLGYRFMCRYVTRKRKEAF